MLLFVGAVGVSAMLARFLREPMPRSGDSPARSPVGGGEASRILITENSRDERLRRAVERELSELEDHT